MKTYSSIIYYNFGLYERINVGLLMFNEELCFIDIKQSKMDLVKQINPGYELFEHTVNSFREYYSNNIPSYEAMKRSSIYNNGMFKNDAPSFIHTELTKESFDKFFDKFI